MLACVEDLAIPKQENIGLWTRERVLTAMEFDPLRDLRNAHRQRRRALRAVLPAKHKIRTLPTGETEETTEEGGAPDWPTRLRAIDQMDRLAGISDRNLESGQDTGRPIAVQIIVQAAGAAQTQDVAVQVAL